MCEGDPFDLGAIPIQQSLGALPVELGNPRLPPQCVEGDTTVNLDLTLVEHEIDRIVVLGQGLMDVRHFLPR